MEIITSLGAPGDIPKIKAISLKRKVCERISFEQSDFYFQILLLCPIFIRTIHPNFLNISTKISRKKFTSTKVPLTK